MTPIKSKVQPVFIPFNLFLECKIDGAKEEFIQTSYSAPRIAFQDSYILKFEMHLASKGYTFKRYAEEFLGVKWTVCPRTGLDVAWVSNKTGVTLRTYVALGNRGKTRPDNAGAMKGRKPWNTGIKAADNQVVARMCGKVASGAPPTEEHRRKMSESAKRRKVHGHTGHKHSEESKKKMSVAVAKRYSDGTFKRKSSIQIEVENFLLSLPLIETPVIEYAVDWYSIDCAFPAAKLAVEVNGTFFHIDPRVYPNGPTNAVQRRNFGRDKRKKAHLESLGWTILPLWEIEVRNGEYKEQLLCKLRELNLLKASA